MWVLMTIRISQRYGMPSYETTRETVANATNRFSDDLIRNDITHFVGDYWDVWPSVFRANWIRYEQNNPQKVWGIAISSNATKKFWGTMAKDQVRIAVPFKPNEPKQIDFSANFLLQAHFPEALRDSQTGNVWNYLSPEAMAQKQIRKENTR